MKRAPYSTRGQAMLELLIAIIAFVVIMAGMVQLGEGGYHMMTSESLALSTASQLAINNQQGSTSAPFILGWDSGSDNIDYTADDQQQGGDPTPFYNAAVATLSTPIVYPSYTAGNSTPNPLQSLNASDATTQGWFMGAGDSILAIGRIDRQNGSQRVVDFGDAVQKLVYGVDQITLHTEVYMPQMNGLR